MLLAGVPLGLGVRGKRGVVGGGLPERGEGGGCRRALAGGGALAVGKGLVVVFLGIVM